MAPEERTTEASPSGSRKIAKGTQREKSRRTAISSTCIRMLQGDGLRTHFVGVVVVNDVGIVFVEG